MVYVLGKTVPGLVCRSHANPLLRALTGYFARQPAIPCLGGAAHARISGPTCELADPRSHERAQARMSGPTLALAGPGADERAHVRIRGPRFEFAGPRTDTDAAAGRTQTEAGKGG